jgi:hypothetical protein
METLEGRRRDYSPAPCCCLPCWLLLCWHKWGNSTYIFFSSLCDWRYDSTLGYGSLEWPVHVRWSTVGHKTVMFDIYLSGLNFHQRLWSRDAPEFKSLDFCHQSLPLAPNPEVQF